MKRLPRLLFCLALLIVAGSALANPYGYAYFRTVTIDHTKVGITGYAAYRTVTVDHTKVQATVNGYSYNRAITFDHTKVGTVSNTDQTNFPVLLSGTFDGSGAAGTPTNLDVRTSANGGPIQNTTTLNGNTVPADLIFTSDAGCTTNLNWEIVSYSASTGAMEAWVKIPTLSHSADTTIYACYKNSSVSTYQGSATSTWDSNFKAVYHLNNNAANTTVTESTSNANTGTNSANTSTTTTTGQITSGFNYAGSYGTVGSNIAALNGGTQMTITAWLNPNTLTQQSRYMVSQADNSFSGFWDFGIDGTFVDALALTANGGACSSARVLTTGSWQFVTVVYDGSLSYGSRCKFYYNGSATTIAGDTQYATLGNGPYAIALATNSNNAAGDKIDAKLDEVQISSSLRSADWVKTAYNNQNSPSTFIKTMGAETPGSLSNLPVLISGTYNGSGGILDVRTAANGGPIQNTTTLNSVTVPADLIFTSDSACATKLNWEIASYTASTGVLEAWVQVPTVSASADTVFYVCYNNAAVTTYQGSATSTWDANYKAVWHENGDPAGGAPQEVDSTSNGKSASVQCCGTPAQVNGQIAKAVNTTSTQGFTAAAENFTTALTVSGWILTTSNTFPAFMEQFDGTGLGAGYAIGINSSNSGRLRLTVSAGLNGGTSQTTYDATSGTVNDGAWHYAVFTYVSGTGFTMYVDGASVGTYGAGYNGSLSNGATTYMANAITGYQWNGYLDETRVSNIARDAGWIKTEYNNQKTPSTFYTLGSEVSLGVDETNFPVLVFCSACTYLKTGANGGQIQKTATLNGQTVPVDLIFTSDAAGQTLLNWEVASYNASTGDTEVWVKIPTLSHTADTVIYMWYNNANIAATYLGSATSVWDANFLSVWHNSQASGTSLFDSTTNAKTLTKASATSPNPTTGGQIGGAQTWIVADQKGASMSNVAAIAGIAHYTAEAWIKLASSVNSVGILSQYTSNSNNINFNLGGASAGIGPNGSVTGWMSSGSLAYGYTAGSLISTGTFYHVVMTYDGTQSTNATKLLIYINGAPQTLTFGGASIPTSTSGGGAQFTAGSWGSNGYFDGVIDEMRLSTSTRPADWITTEYYNQNSPSTFVTIGSQNIAQHHTKGFME